MKNFFKNDTFQFIKHVSTETSVIVSLRDGGRSGRRRSATTGAPTVMHNRHKEQRRAPALDDHVTSLILRRLPPNISNSRLVQHLDTIVPGKYDFIHVPHHQQTGHNIALAFINFVNHQSARTVYDAFMRRDRHRAGPWHRTQAAPGNMQGLSANLSYFLVRFGVEALHKFGAPMIFEDGVPVQLSVQMLRRHLNPDMLAHGFEMAASSNQVKHKSRVNSVPAAIEPSLCFGEETWASKKDTSVPSASSGRVLANAERPQESSTSTGHDTSGECTEASISEGTWDGVTSSPTGLDELNVSSYWKGNMRVWQL